MKCISKSIEKNAGSRSGSLSIDNNDPDVPSSRVHFATSTHPFINRAMSLPYSKPTLFQEITGPIRGFLPSLRRGRHSSRDPDGIIAPRSPGGTRLSSHPHSTPHSPSYSPSSPTWTYGNDPASGDYLNPGSPHRSTFQQQHETSDRRLPFLASPPPPRRSTSEGVGRLATSASVSASGASPRPGKLASRMQPHRSHSSVSDTWRDDGLFSGRQGRSESPDASAS
jgi:hypothetical protein